jgi:hypothetical protein
VGRDLRTRFRSRLHNRSRDRFELVSDARRHFWLLRRKLFGAEHRRPVFSTSGTISFAVPVTSFTFLWGSPDSYNSVTDGTVTVTGSTFSSGAGNNAETTLYTFFDALGFTSLTFSTTGIAFEVAVAAVPEPQTYAMMLAGLGVLAFLARRRRS